MSDLGIGSLGQSFGTLSIGGTQSADALLNASPTTYAVQTGAATGATSGQAASVDISQDAQLFSKLEQLKAQDPAKYQQTVTDIANQLQQAAQSSQGTDQKFLSDLASKFQKAASGDSSALQPPGQGQANGNLALNASNTALNLYGQNAASNTSPFSQSSGKHSGHHHHAPSASTQQTLSNITNEVNSALGDSSTDTTAAQAAAAAA